MSHEEINKRKSSRKFSLSKRSMTSTHNFKNLLKTFRKIIDHACYVNLDASQNSLL